MNVKTHRTPFLPTAAFAIAAVLVGCGHLQPKNEVTINVTKPPAAPGFVAGSPRGARITLEKIADARTEREAINAVVEYAIWTQAESSRMGLENHSVIVRSIKANPYLRDPRRVISHFFSVESVWPEDCSPEAHLRLKHRIGEMMLVADACEQHGLIRALESRLELVMNSRARLDVHGICLDT